MALGMTDRLLLHTVSYAGLWGQVKLSLEATIDKAADLGFGGVMIMAKRPHFSLLDYSMDRRLRLRDQIAARGLKRVCLAGYNNFTADLAHGEIPHGEIQVHYLTEMARAARDIGAFAVRVFTGYEETAAPFSRQWDLVVLCLREAAGRASEFGVQIGVQNHHDLGADWESLRDLIAEVDHPNCRAMFDAWAPALQGVDLATAARALAGASIHTTVANYQKRPRFHYAPALVNYESQTPRVVATTMRDGFIDYAGFFAALRQGGFSGTIAYEMCSPLLGGGTIENLDLHARAFLEWIEEHAE